MKKSIQKPKVLGNKIEKILRHQIISEFDPKKGIVYETKKYKIKWVGKPECTWEKESNLKNYENIINDYKKLCGEKEIDNYNTFGVETSVYNEYNMRKENKNKSINENKINHFSLNNIYKIEKEKFKRNINKNFNENKIINLDESSSEVNDIENESQNGKEIKNLSKSKKHKNTKEINLNKPDYENFGPSFKDVLKAGQNKELNEVNQEKKFLNKKRKNNANIKPKISKNEPIHQINVPSDKNENISNSNKRKFKGKNISTRELSNSNNIPRKKHLKK